MAANSDLALYFKAYLRRSEFVLLFRTIPTRLEKRKPS
jgi:hypothetical protein